MNPWHDFALKLALAAFNSLALGGVALAVGYWFNRRLERHRRNEAITAELGKQSLAAYVRILTAVGEINGFMFFAEAAAKQDDESTARKKRKPVPHPFADDEQAVERAFRECFKSAPLVNETFADAAIRFVAFACRHLDDYAPASDLARKKLEEQRLAMLVTVGQALPAFVKLPNEDAFQYTRSLEDLLVQAGIWKRDETGGVRVAD